MGKIACVFSFEESNWVSCQKIVFNLHSSYRITPENQIVNFNYSVQQEMPEIQRLAQEIFEQQPDIISFVDHQPNPLLLVALLLFLYDEKPKPRIVFHIFGDFSLAYPKWDKIGELLQGLEVDFFVPSDRQKIFFDRFLQGTHKSIVCPFPVDETEFSHRPDLRRAQRKSWEIEDNELAFVFTGRLSRQKRIHTLLKAFADSIAIPQSNPAHLYLYGDADSIGDPFLDKWETDGEYFRMIHRLYMSFPHEIKSRIHFMGSVSSAELISVYQGADALVNLSVHNDEDYGMSVAEAQASGLPCILADWGGFSSFEHHELPAAIQFVPVTLGSRSKLLSREKASTAFKNQRGLNPSDQKKLSALALSKFSTKAVQKILTKRFNAPGTRFSGFSPFFNKVVEETSWSTTPYMTDAKHINKLYKEIYSPYVRAD